MMHTKAVAVLLLVGQILCQSESDKSQQSAITDYDPQLLNYQLQQLAVQQYSGQQYARQVQVPEHDAQSLHYAAQTQQLTQQDYDAARLLQTKLFEPYQGQLSTVQSQGGQYSAQQSAPVAPHSAGQQQAAKQSLLGVAYSSAADASKTSFTGYGIKYSF